jgi:toxin ParE1/3/4
VKFKRPVFRRQASQDVDEAVDYYLHEAGIDVALGFVDSLKTAYLHLSRHPQTGSSRYAHELDLPGLRMWPLRSYPLLIFYLEQPDHLDIWLVLHSQRQLPAWLVGS